MTTAVLDPVSTSAIREAYVSRGERSAIPIDGSGFDSGTEARVGAIFRSHPYLKRKAELIQVRCTNRCLQLSGVLPSYYLKQLAQEAIKGQCRDLYIENRILVVSPENEFQL
jgi:hypothetical protein